MRRKYIYLFLAGFLFSSVDLIGQCITNIKPDNSSTLRTNRQLQFNWTDNLSDDLFVLRIFNSEFDTLIGGVNRVYWMNAQGVLEPNTNYNWEVWDLDTLNSLSCEVFNFTTTDDCDPALVFDEDLIRDYFNFDADLSLDVFSGSNSQHIALNSEFAYSGQGNSVMILMPAGNNRSELSFKSVEDQNDKRNHINEEMFYNYKLMIPRHLNAEGSRRIINQWHSQPIFSCGEEWGFEGPPPVSVSVHIDTIKLGMRWPLDTVLHGGSPYGNTQIPFGEWIDVMIHIKWSMDYNGFVEMFINGEPNTPYNGVDYKVYGKTLKNAAANYFKFGQYTNAPKSGVDTIFFDNVNINVLTNRKVDKSIEITSHEQLFPDSCSTISFNISDLDSLDFVNSYQFEMAIPENCQLLSLETENTLSFGGQLDYHVKEDTFRVGYIQTSSIFGDKELIRLKLSFTAEDNYLLKPHKFLLNADYQSKVSGGILNVKYPVFQKGDIDFDEEITVYDASLALQYAVNLDPLPNVDPLPWLDSRVVVADVNEDGIIGSYDASLILRKSLGLINDFSRVANSQPKMVIDYSDGFINFYGSGDLYSVKLKLNEALIKAPLDVSSELSEKNFLSNEFAIASSRPLNQLFLRFKVDLIEDVDLKISINDLDFYTETVAVNALISTKSEELTVYPNPVKSRLFIGHAEWVKKLSVYNGVGQLINRDVKKLGFIDLETFDSGLYFLVFEFSDGSRVIRKVVKE